MGIFVICFLLNDISLAEDGNRPPYTIIASKANIEPAGKIVPHSICFFNFIFFNCGTCQVLLGILSGSPLEY